MRRSLLNKQILPKPLRQALVLITLLLLPSAAWGQDPTPYGITVAGTQVTSGNATNIFAGDQSNDGKVSFTPAEGTNPATLTLDGATITGSIVKTASEAGDQLTINLVGTNTVNGQILFQSEDRKYPGELTFTGDGSLNIASNDQYGVIDGVSSVNTGEGLYIATDSPNPQVYNGYFINSTNASDNSVKSLTVSTSVTYPIWVYNNGSNTKYTQLTFANSSTSPFSPQEDTGQLVNHSGSVSFNGTTLTLNSFICNTTDDDYVFFIGESKKELTINLEGTSSIYGKCFHYLTNNNTLTFITSEETPGSLEFTTSPSFWGDVTFQYLNGLRYDIEENIITTAWTRLKIGNDTRVKASTNSPVSLGDNKGYYSYDDETNTLTLENATIGSQDGTITPINVYIKDLNVAFSGNNTLYSILNGEFQEGSGYTGTIHFQNADFSNASLTIIGSSEDSSPVTGFKECTMSDGLNLTAKKKNGEVYNVVEGVEYRENRFTNGTVVPDYINIAYQAPPLTVAGIEPDSEGKFEGLAGVTYTPPTISLDSQIPDTPATLTLDGATIDGYISSSIENLTVYLKGSSTINAGTNVSPFRYFMATETSSSTGSLTFDSTDEDEGMLTMNGISAENKIASGYTVSPKFTYYDDDSNYEGWIKGSYSDPESIFIYKNVNYNLWISNMEGTSTIQYNKYNVANTEYGPVYHPETHSLDITGNYSYYIKSSLPVLTLNLKPGGIIPKVVFEPKDEEESGSLEIITKEETASITFGSNTNTQPVISGFSDVVYDGFTILSDGAQYDKTGMQLVNASGTAMTEAVFVSSVEINKPTFDSTSGDGGVWVLLTNDNKYTIVTNSEVTPVESHDINYGTIKYSIEYADGSEGVTDEIFTEAFTISKPATVTAKVTLNGESSDNAIGKYFGAKDVFTVAIGDKIEGTSWFTPAIESGDQIESKFMLQGNDESGIFEMGGEGPDHYLVAKKSGETTVIAYLFSSSSSSSSTGTTVLNVSGEPILITFTVGESLSSVFEGNNNYGGFYNDSDTPYAKPEGTSVYLITGISEDGTSVTTQSIDYLPAHTAVLLQKGTDAKAITKIPYEGSATVPTNNKFYYSNPNSPATAPTTRSWYVIYNNQFVKVTGGTQVKGGKCYLDLGTTAGTRGFYNIGDGEGTTAIHKVISEGVNSEKWTDGEWYTLQGQRVAKPAKGLYILNGKKVVVK